MYRLHTAYGITSIPLLGLGTADCLLACLCLHFPCERPRPSLNRSPVTASRAPYQQASCYPKSKAGPAQNPHLLLHHSPLDQLQGRPEHLRLFGRARTDTNIPPQTTPSDSNCISHSISQPLHSRRAAPILLPSALELLLRSAASSFSLLLLLIPVPLLLSQRR
ncbi:hypothetical protein GGI43DRAFT_294445 [Trichoderma evansii]